MIERTFRMKPSRLTPQASSLPDGLLLVEQFGGPRDGHAFGVAEALVFPGETLVMTVAARRKHLVHVYRARRPRAAGERIVVLYYAGVERREV